MAIDDPYWLDRDRTSQVAQHVATLQQIADHLLRDVVPEMGSTYDGTPESIIHAMSDVTSPVYRERDERFTLTTLRQAYLVDSNHRPVYLAEYLDSAKVPTIKGYLAALRRRESLTPL